MSSLPTDDPDKLYSRPVPAFGPLWEYAEDTRYRSFFMWGGRGGAKSTAMAQLFAARGRIDRGVFLCTREVQNSLAESVMGAIRQAIEDNAIPGYHITDKGINYPGGARMVFAGLGYREGIHVKSTVDIVRCWVEEAQQVSEKSLEILIPTVREPGSQMYYTFNRTGVRDPVWDLWQAHRTRSEVVKWRFEGKRIQWKLHRGDGAIGIEINYDGNPYFPDVLENERRKAYKNSMETGRLGSYKHVWLGLPVDAGEMQIITTEQAMNAIARTVEPEGAIEVGADIARGDRDKVVFYKRHGLKVIDVRVYSNNSSSEKMRITETAERLMAFSGDPGDAFIKIDDTGLGGGVTDILEDKGYNVAGVNFAQAAVDSEHYKNAASEMWFDAAKSVEAMDLPDDVELLEELTERREWRRDNKGRRAVEPKDEFIARVGRSPDKADALLLCFYEPNSVVREIKWTIA